MSDVRITYQEYWAEVKSIANDVAREVIEDDCDAYDRLHEVVDGHRWIVYYCYNMQVLMHCSDANAYFEDFGPIEQVDDLHDLLCKLAYAALYRDVGARLDDAIEAARKQAEQDEQS